MNAGIIDVNTLNVGVTYSTNGTTTTIPRHWAGNGTVNMTGGLLVVNDSLTLAATAVAGVGSGTLNISSATVTANNGITVGGGASVINLTGSTLNTTNSIATHRHEQHSAWRSAITNSTLNLALQIRRADHGDHQPRRWRRAKYHQRQFAVP